MSLRLLPLVVATISASAMAAAEIVGIDAGAVKQSSVVDAGPLAIADKAASKVVRVSGLNHQSALVGEHDGARFALIRLRSAGAAALRAHIRNLRLPEGARLFVYGLNSAGELTEVDGPYQAAGPRFGEDFWTSAVSGSELVIEMQITGEWPSDLPFDIDRLAWADRPEKRSVEAISSRTSLFRGIPVTHAVEDELAIFEGDIILGRADELRPANGGSKLTGRTAVAVTGDRFRWPGGVMPYVIDTAFTDVSKINEAIQQWNTTLAGHVRLIPRTTEGNYVRFVRPSNGGRCASSVGMSGYGEQQIQAGDYCSTGNIVHEIGHALGLWHEQGREDRDNFIRILWENIQSAAIYNFYQNTSNGDDLGAYDYGSVMHYPANAFSSNGRMTIETIPAGIFIGQRSRLSTGDIAAIRALYPATQVPVTPTFPVTVISNPPGMPVTVDGRSHITPAEFEWSAGSSHVLSAGNSTLPDRRHLFQSWSNGGAQSHSVTASAATTVYSATYSMAYALDVSATAGGAVSRYPTSADDFYPANTTVRLSAYPYSGHCFTSWSGLLAGTPSGTTVTMTKPYSITAVFQPGSVTLAPASLSIPAAGGAAQFAVTASTGCAWTAHSNVWWIGIVSGNNGGSTSTVTINAAPNTTGSVRMGSLDLGGKTLMITQAAQ